MFARCSTVRPCAGCALGREQEHADPDPLAAFAADSAMATTATPRSGPGVDRSPVPSTSCRERPRNRSRFVLGRRRRPDALAARLAVRLGAGAGHAGNGASGQRRPRPPRRP
ncbi:MAG: hypothetical protein R2705_24295 [Ilumatobacteraceae bacterium]